jgi:pyridoxamine 5'-phosphate oxidase
MFSNLEPVPDPLLLFAQWMRDAAASEPNDPNAMALATAGSNGLPDVRMVLLRGADKRGFVFYTNLESAKGVALTQNPWGALCFHWKTLRRQVRIRGKVDKVSDEEADAYFDARPRGSRIGAWASQQSRPLESRLKLEEAVADYTGKYMIGDIPRPPYWSGFRLRPDQMEFWVEENYRLHHRMLYKRKFGGGGWDTTRLYP